ncbi:MAG TPA: hypothetical protein VHE30_01325 [Polyangiaceae bacterium]|nr:hypothetical protein [Polyangiaceae bacterium]
MLVVPGRPTSDGLTWWVLSEDSGAPHVELVGPDGEDAGVVIRPLSLPQDGPVAKRCFLVSTTALRSDSVYRLDASRNGVLASASSRTLPASLPVGQSFTVALGSCYSIANDPGLTASYPPKLHDPNGRDPIRLRFLGGDQLYMDLTASSGSPIIVGAPDPWEKYLAQWERLQFSTFLRASPNLVLGDDHEFWNDYPHKSAWLTWSESERGGPVGRAMDRAFSLFQVGLNLEPGAVQAPPGGNLGALLGGVGRTFSLDVGPLSFFVLDVRTARTRYDAGQPHFTAVPWLSAARAWIQGLRGPGVLVLSQPLVEERAGAFARTFHTMGDVNLPDYDDDFAALWEALFAAPHDVVVLTGDIHWSRAYRIRRAGASNRTVWEVVSSSLARIPGPASGIGEATGKVEWRTGRGNWTRDYATNAASTYTTLSFTPQSGGVNVVARAFQVSSERGVGASLLSRSSIGLT